MQAETVTAIPATPQAVIEAVLDRDRRVLLVGPAGAGKSTLVNGLALALGRAGRTCWCIGADPGSPLFGVPGAVCLGRWIGHGWEVAGLEALCTLDAGRFRLPLVSAVARLAGQAPAGIVLVDGPGVVRGVAGAELLAGIAAAAGIEVVIALVREDRPLPLVSELAALKIQTIAVRASAEARRPGKRVRARQRSLLWDAYLGDGSEQDLDVRALPIVGTPPPMDASGAWRGRQVALMDGERTLAMGEAVALEQGMLRVHLPVKVNSAGTLLVRDAQRGIDGLLGTSAPFAAEPLGYLPPTDMASEAPAGESGGPRVVGRVGSFSISLANGVFGDPLLHVRLRHARRSLLFDLGAGSRLAARIAHQVTDVFITHAHIDHIAGFLWLLRSRIGDYPVCRLYGPPGLAANIEGMTRGVLWDRVEDRGPRFEVSELHGERLCRFRVQAGRPGCELFDERVAADGVVLSEAAFQVRATTLEHVSPVLAYALQPARQLNVRKDRLSTRRLEPGRWLGELKRRVLAKQWGARIALPDGRSETADVLAADLLLVTPGKKLVYATDFRDSADNRTRLLALARGAHTLFCESTFLEQDAEQAARTAHLTTRACGEIAEAAGVARLVPFHFSRRYEQEPERIYEEIAAVWPRVVTPKSMAVFDASDSP